jgi:hypothetical protein
VTISFSRTVLHGVSSLVNYPNKVAYIYIYAFHVKENERAVDISRMGDINIDGRILLKWIYVAKDTVQWGATVNIIVIILLP